MSAAMLSRSSSPKTKDCEELEIKSSGVHRIASVRIATSKSVESGLADQINVRSRDLFPRKTAMLKRRLYLTRDRLDYCSLNVRKCKQGST